MATPKRSRARNSRFKGRLRYFYLDGDLHRSLHANIGADHLTAWNYPQHKMVGLSYRDVRRNAGRAFTTKEVSELVRRNRQTIENTIINGDIEAPQKTYALGDHQKGKEYKYMWSEQDVINLHQFLCTVHYGRPRNDGMITPYNLPSLRELRAMMRQEVVLYMKNEDGKFVPTWEANTY